MGIDVSKIPPGPWRTAWNQTSGMWDVWRVAKSAPTNIHPICMYVCGQGGDGAHTAELIVEAGNVATETGKTPRQLAEQVAELEKACVEAANDLRLDPTKRTAYNVAADLDNALANTAPAGGKYKP